jgi:hypothetical protein
VEQILETLGAMGSAATVEQIQAWASARGKSLDSLSQADLLLICADHPAPTAAIAKSSRGGKATKRAAAKAPAIASIAQPELPSDAPQLVSAHQAGFRQAQADAFQILGAAQLGYGQGLQDTAQEVGAAIASFRGECLAAFVAAL